MVAGVSDAAGHAGLSPWRCPEAIGAQGIAVTLRMRNVQPSLWESVLPKVCLRLPAELQRVDAWLADERFFAPFVAHFSAPDAILSRHG
jgi:hypothetical protein